MVQYMKIVAFLDMLHMLILGTPRSVINALVTTAAKGFLQLYTLKVSITRVSL